MNLQIYYETYGAKGLKRLAESVGANSKYLYQCATGRKTPSPKLAIAIVRFDSRFTLDGIYAHVSADNENKEAA